MPPRHGPFNLKFGGAMPTITITCPTCTTQLEIDAKYRNEEVECGNCQQVFIAKPKGESSPDEDGWEVTPSPKRKNRFRKERTKDDDDYEDDYEEDDDDYEEDRPRRRSRYRRERARDYTPKSRLAYILIALFLGWLGIHNFYAGRTGAGVGQLLITIFSWPLMCVGVGFVTVFIPVVWSIVDIIAIDRDGDGYPMA